MARKVKEANLNKGDIAYQKYYKYIQDERWYEQLLHEIAPNLNLGKASTVSFKMNSCLAESAQLLEV